MTYKEMWEELKSDLKSEEQKLSVFRSMDFTNQARGVKLTIDKMEAFEAAYKDELPPEEGTTVWAIICPSGFTISRYTTRLVEVSYENHMEHRLGNDIFINREDAVKEYNNLVGIE
jgi:hypothetical protein